MPDITTLSMVKQYLAITTAGADALISRLIPRESRLIEQWTGRLLPFVLNTARRLNGTGTPMLMLPDQPILDVQALSIDGIAVPGPAGSSPGFTFDDTTIYLTAGRAFPMGRQNVTCSWSAGYQANVPALIPDGNTPTLLIENPGTPALVNSVTSDIGVVFAKTANAPAAGQYQFNAPSLVFAAADANTAIAVDMYYVPPPIEQVCIEMVGLDLKQRDNLGINSKTLAGETISYERAGMTASVKEMLQPYKKVTPV